VHVPVHETPTATRIAQGLHELGLALERETWLAAVEDGVSPTEGQILAALATSDRTRPAQLAERLGVSPRSSLWRRCTCASRSGSSTPRAPTRSAFARSPARDRAAPPTQQEERLRRRGVDGDRAAPRSAHTRGADHHDAAPFLANKGHGAADVDGMAAAWLKSCLLQVTPWSHPYVRAGDF